uniref:Uncharacterized protein n=1 Tax=Oryza brachyantha TaxID=4533 RepID=J3NAY2_ORYBR
LELGVRFIVLLICCSSTSIILIPFLWATSQASHQSASSSRFDLDLHCDVGPPLQAPDPRFYCQEA